MAATAIMTHNDVILLLSITYLSSSTRILSDMMLLRLCGYTSNRDEILIKYLFSQ